MRLKRLEIQGFKSFMDKTVITFDQGITGIVGPNGSGKSNIGDAVRWVLGEQSARVLRGAKMEDVIFNGTQKRKRAAFCEVSLVFDNEDMSLKSAFSEVMVTRRVFRNGDSDYLLNKAPCRLRDILELFRDTGIGREGYSLIGQGRIDEILSQKSEDRRQVFEEAAGIMTFRVRKEEAERKLVKTADHLSRVYDILSELETRLLPLEKQAQVAKEYQSLFITLKSLEVNIFLLRYDVLNARIKTLDHAQKEQNDLLLSYEARINEINQKRAVLDDEILSIEESLSNMRTYQVDKNQALHEEELHLERIKNALVVLQTDYKNALQEKQDLLSKKTMLSSMSKQNEEQICTQKEQVDKAFELQNALTEKVNCAVLDAQEKEALLDTHKNNILDTVNRLSDARDTQTRQTAILQQMKARLLDVEKKTLSLNENESVLQASVLSANSALESTKQNYNKLFQEVQGFQSALSQKKEQKQSLLEKAQALNLKLQGALSREKLMTEMHNEMEGFQLSVKKALAFSKDDLSVHGALARIISVDEKYETAIDMVLGGALQNIVTEDEHSAKRMIEYLKQNRLGRATFLPLSAIKPRVLNQSEKNVLSMKGCLGVASDLISYDIRFQNVVQNLLGRTLIADNLNNGIEIMKRGNHQFRLVTLSGDVMHSGGSMTGGTAQGKASSLLGRERQIKELRAEIHQMKEALSFMQKELSLLDAQILEDKNALFTAQEALHQEDIAVTRDRERMHSVQNEHDTLLQSIHLTNDAKEQLEEGILQIQQDLEKAQAAAQNVSVDRKKMEEQTDILQNALYDARQTLDSLRNKLTSAQLMYQEEKHTLHVLSSDQDRKNQEIQSILQEVSQIEDRNTHRLAEEKNLNEHISACKTILSDLETQNNAALQKISNYESERIAKAALQRECIKQSDETHTLYDQVSSLLHKTELQLSRTQTDLDSMCEHILSAYDLTYSTAEEYRSSLPFDLPEGEREATKLRAKIKALGMVNVSAIEEYENEKNRFDTLSAQRNDLLKAKEDLETLIARLMKQMESVFIEEFTKLGAYFSVTFERLFGGGQAELKLQDAHNPLSCGIEIVAQPPGKKLQLLSLLSGGERALTAIAILFAMLKLKPTPFCILDEIEAALDEANITYFADYLSEYKNTTQFVVVTHRKGTMERCDALYGVAMQEKGVSSMVSVDLKDYH